MARDWLYDRVLSMHVHAWVAASHTWMVSAHTRVVERTVHRGSELMRVMSCERVHVSRIGKLVDTERRGDLGIEVMWIDFAHAVVRRAFC